MVKLLITFVRLRSNHLLLIVHIGLTIETNMKNLSQALATQTLNDSND